MTLQRSGGAAALSATAEDYARTMAPALRPVAVAVVEAAGLRAGERVLDVGTGTGTAAGLARGDGRSVSAVDAAAGMLAIARREVPGVEFVEADFSSLPFADDAFDVVLAAHGLLFADDRVAALAEWRRVSAAGGRLSVSVPGPFDRVAMALFAPIYERHGLRWGDDYPDAAQLAAWAAAAGWTDVTTRADPSVSIPLDDDDAFRAWLRVGARGRATQDWTDAQRDRLARELMAATPRDESGGYRLPFGALFLVAINPG